MWDSLGRGNLGQNFDRERGWAVWRIMHRLYNKIAGLTVRGVRLQGKGLKRCAETQPYRAFCAMSRSLDLAGK